MIVRRLLSEARRDESPVAFRMVVSGFDASLGFAIFGLNLGLIERQPFSHCFRVATGSAQSANFSAIGRRLRSLRRFFQPKPRSGWTGEAEPPARGRRQDTRVSK